MDKYLVKPISCYKWNDSIYLSHDYNKEVFKLLLSK